MAVGALGSLAPNRLARSRALRDSDVESACGVDSASASAPFVVLVAPVPKRSARALRLANSESMLEVGRFNA